MSGASIRFALHMDQLDWFVQCNSRISKLFLRLFCDFFFGPPKIRPKKSKKSIFLVRKVTFCDFSTFATFLRLLQKSQKCQVDPTRCVISATVTLDVSLVRRYLSVEYTCSSLFGTLCMCSIHVFMYACVFGTAQQRRVRC